MSAKPEDMTARMADPNQELGITAERAESLHTLWFTVRRMCAGWRGHVAHMAASYGLSSPQFTVFMALASGGRMTMGQIGERSVLPTSSLTALVDRLVDLGLAAREQHPADRRAIQVQLTDDGRALADRVMVDTLRDTQLMTAGLDVDELDRISAGIEQLLAGYQRYAAGGTDAASSGQTAGS